MNRENEGWVNILRQTLSSAGVVLLVSIVLSGSGCSDQGAIDPGPTPMVASLFAINGDGVVTLGWTAVEGQAPSEIDVHRSTDPNFTPSSQNLYAALPGNATRFDDMSIGNGTTQYYRIAVKAENTPFSQSNVAIGQPNSYDSIATVQYSQHIQPIFNSSCAVQGCHVGEDVGAQFSLKSWEDLFAGSDDGAVAIPFFALKSDLVFHVNSDTLVAPAAMPHMPLEGFDMPASQVQTLIRWIDEGGKSDAGEVPYSVTPEGKMIVVCAAEDLIAVIDVQTELVIRYIKVASAADPNSMFGSPHHIKVDKQGLHFYVTLINSQQLLKFSVASYELEASLSIPFQPADLILTSTGDSAYVTSFGSTQGLVTLVDTRQMTILRSITVPFASNPHGIIASHNGSKIYVGNAGSGNVTEINTSDYSTMLIALDTLGNPFQSNVSPYLLDLTPDDRYLFVTDYANGGQNIYVIDLVMDPTKPTHVVPIGGRSVHVAVTPDGASAFACNITTNSVHVISTVDFSVRKISNVGEQPHGVIFTPDGMKAYITTENTFSPDPPHHPTSGSGGISFVYIIDVPTLAILKAIEVGAVSQGLAFAP